MGTASTAQSATLTNTGNATLTVTGISVTGTNGGDFAETSTCGNSVNANASCTISVIFTPAATGTRTANVSISDNASGSPQSIALTGIGAGASSENTPLVDFTENQQYLGTFPGLLYTDPATGINSNTVPTQHDADGRSIAAAVVPLDANGDPSSSGKIGVIAIGMSNWAFELCRGDPANGPCLPGTFLEQAGASPQVNHTTMVLVDCAQPGHTAMTWIGPGPTYTTCLDQRLPALGITAQQVEVVLWKDADAYPSVSLTSSTVCQWQAIPISSSNPDACTYEEFLGLMARYVKTVFPNVKQLFVHSRTYGGYATTNLNPEPFAYEYGFATKWFVNAQIVQIAGGEVVDKVAGDLNYMDGTAPWIAWGPYWWAAGTTPCNNCQIPGQTWVQSDFMQTDGTHPAGSGDTKVGNNLISFYLSSPYSPWFRAQ